MLLENVESRGNGLLRQKTGHEEFQIEKFDAQNKQLDKDKKECTESEEEQLPWLKIDDYQNQIFFNKQTTNY